MTAATPIEPPARPVRRRATMREWIAGVGKFMALGAILGGIAFGSVGLLVGAALVLFVAIHITALAAVIHLVRRRGRARDLAWVAVSVALLVARELPLDGPLLHVEAPFSRPTTHWSVTAGYTRHDADVAFDCTLEVADSLIGRGLAREVGCVRNRSAETRLRVRIDLDVDDRFCYLPLYTRVHAQLHVEMTGSIGRAPGRHVASFTVESERSVLGFTSCYAIRMETARILAEQVRPRIFGAVSALHDGY